MNADETAAQVRVAFVSSEAVPFAKTGGLADVSGALPRALSKLGHRPVLFLPLYRPAWRVGVKFSPTSLSLRIPMGDRLVEGSLFAAELPGSNVPVYLVHQSGYFDRDNLYGRNGTDYHDNFERFVFFQRAVLEAIRLLDLRPHLVHCNDWQTGLIPVLLKELYADDPVLGGVGSLLSIHNMAYQGSFRPDDLPLTGLDWRLFNWQQLEHHGSLNFLKAGLVFADMLSTVSPTYAREIQTPDQGRGLDAVLRIRSGDLRGIVNGIDTTVWNPRLDPQIAENYDPGTVAEGKPDCKAWLQRRASLPERPEVPLFAAIGRLDSQKGWDLLLEIADGLLQTDVQLIVLGEGHAHYHDALDRLAARYPAKLRAFLEFSSPLAHQIEAGADLFLMPSLYEPCGLNQLYSQAYGTVPIARATGGLSDTVVDATPENLAAGTATGFLFQEPTGRGLRGAIDRALALWPDRRGWHGLVAAGMRADWSWDRSAREYVSLYTEVRDRVSASMVGR